MTGAMSKYLRNDGTLLAFRCEFACLLMAAWLPARLARPSICELGTDLGARDGPVVVVVVLVRSV